MIQHLYLVRHAHAHDDAPDDTLRALSPKGHKQCKRIAKGLAGKDLVKVETIWHSGLLRAHETAQALATGLSLTAALVQTDGLAPDDNPKQIAAQLNAQSINCLVAGHEPNLSRLASILLTGRENFQRVVFPKASILCLSRVKIRDQSSPWQIEWHLNDKHYK